MTTISSSEVFDRAKELHEQIRTWRRTIHANPELKFAEHETAGLVAKTLDGLQIETETEVAKTGVVGHIKGSSGPLVGLRADMDALPILEENETKFNSQRPGVMHACGHDSHTAMLLGAGTILKELADAGRLPGNVRLLFQPSEEGADDEGKSGGLRMVEEGALNHVDAVFGIHVNPFLDTGNVASRTGAMLAAADTFEIQVRGAGGHAAMPHRTIDPIVLSSHVINAIHQVVSRRLDPIEVGVITIGTINGGTASNVIPDVVTMTGTIRSMSSEARTLLREGLYQACRVVEPLGGSTEIAFHPGYPATINDDRAVDILLTASGEFLGADKIHESPKIMGAEDFSYMLQQAPGCMVLLGVHDPSWGDNYYPIHTSTFRLDEDALPIGAASLALAAIRWMEQEGN